MYKEHMLLNLVTRRTGFSGCLTNDQRVKISRNGIVVIPE